MISKTKKIKQNNKDLKQYFVFIDESGTLPDIKDKFIIIAGVGAEKFSG